jgi:hypothetical protein
MRSAAQRFFLLVSLSVMLVACAVNHPDNASDGNNNCELTTIPSNARRVATHGADFYFFPSSLPDQYNGCQVMWLGDGTKLSVARYVHGKIESFNGQEPKSGPFQCKYSNGNLIEAESTVGKCPPAEQFPL